jgi:phosphomethylpyrimidine synthase
MPSRGAEVISRSDWLPAAVGKEVSGVVEDGMAAMSAGFREMGAQVYVETQKVKKSNRVL